LALRADGRQQRLTKRQPDPCKTVATAVVNSAVWPTTRSASRLFPAPMYCETSAIVAAVIPIAVDTNIHDNGNISETAATASPLTRPTQNISARL